MKPVFDSHGLATSAGEVRCFYYSQDTGEYTGWSDEYINIGLSMPARSTDIDPGNDVPGFAYVYENGGWVIKEDHRGETVYILATGEAVKIINIGPYPEGTSTSLPEKSVSELYDEELQAINAKYTFDINSLAVQWGKVGLFDGGSEQSKKEVLYAHLQERNLKYSVDLEALDQKYGD